MKSKINQTIVFKENIYITSWATVVGPMEKDGPIGECFDKTYDSLYCDEESWELAERKMMAESVKLCLEKKSQKTRRYRFLYCGRSPQSKYHGELRCKGKRNTIWGIFSACSTSVEGLALSAVLVDGGFAKRVVTGSQ
ncbi:MAG: hypothetical protein LRY71_12795 [Bacillaceae bacterium]|nr:hypothetical protein [Bacillaceae bacterium]